MAYIAVTPFLDEQDYIYSAIFTAIFLLIIERFMKIVIHRERIWDIAGVEMFEIIAFPVMGTIILYCVTVMESGFYRLIACISVVVISILSVNPCLLE